ncbi:MAG: flagellar motor switch protein FliM [Planctomycetota bacterium]
MRAWARRWCATLRGRSTAWPVAWVCEGIDVSARVMLQGLPIRLPGQMAGEFSANYCASGWWADNTKKPAAVRPCGARNPVVAGRCLELSPLGRHGGRRVSDLLDQSEIDALLAAVDAGDVSSDSESAAPGSSGGLSRGFGGPGGDYAHPNQQRDDVQTYDFKRPERVSKDQMRSLETLHEAFARSLGATLSGSLRTIVEVSVSQIEQLTYSEFVHSLPNPTCFNLLSADELGGQLCLEISPLIIYPIIDRLLGGSNAELFIPQRPLTTIEQGLVSRITDRATHHLSAAWSQVMPVTFNFESFESNAQLVQIVPPNETVVVIGFEIKMGNRAGTMALCFPYQTIDPVMSRLSQQNWFNYDARRSDDGSELKLRDGVDNAEVEVRAVLAKTTMKLSDLMNLQAGDLVTTGKSTHSEVGLHIEGRRKFSGKMGQYRGNRCIKVTGKVESKPAVQAIEEPVVAV